MDRSYDIEQVRRLAAEALELCDRLGLDDAACHLQMGIDRLPGSAGAVREERLPWGLDEAERPQA